MTRSPITWIFCLVFSSALSLAAQADAREPVPVLEADRKTMTKAMAHYARSRQLLIAALREFDKGYQSVNPDVILSGEAFRESLIERAEELEKLLAPQARIDRSGMQFDPNPAFLSGANNR